ncbi:molecular chaperone TorD family protein [Micromonospora aurantiaca]|uniref:Molecular chaperone TorD family protein n=1 Tax=Micromonospora aurantiaca (nom. illeg.) TaxID=47850 RepID=A0ABQ6ULA8_9ACTN|nr:molecular chaperone TorD family protein [Micromonospora aurantiaca]KAB1117924.1 molecular chaperone TorD family protein [Micromonospora aurantiaca]UFN92627.1 molecular chaperone TorD family protein [Micromonospora aurantiaca]
MTTLPLAGFAPGRTRNRAELFRALGALAEAPGEAQLRLADLLRLPRPSGEQWTEAFVVQLVPHASVYLGAEGMLGGEAADRVAGFWRALRLPVPSDADHVAALLGLYAALADAECDEPAGPRRTMRRQARVALFHEHLASWLPAYARAMADSGPAPYAQWARLLHDALLAEAAEIGLPDRPPAHLRDVAPLGDGGGLDGLLTGLLTPARSGVIITRAHLATVARGTGLGLRLGDRRRVLRALLEQDPAVTLAALAEQAREWWARHRADEPVVGPAARHWAERAAITADVLTAAQREAHMIAEKFSHDDRL